MKKTKVLLSIAGLTIILGSSFASLKVAYAESSQNQQPKGKPCSLQKKKLAKHRGHVHFLEARILRHVL